MMSNTVSLHPYFRVHEGKMDEFKAMLPQFVEKTSSEALCLYYDFTISGDTVFCREAYEGADGLLAHLGNVTDLLEEALEISELFRLEVHGSAAELEKLKEPLAELNVEPFVRACGAERP
jgi:quinol monooxygenase YgiN